jgi:hypothetical protein
VLSESLILRIERLRDDLVAFRKELRARSPKPAAQIDAKDLRKTAARLSEVWMVEMSGSADVAEAIGADTLADLNIEFQRLLTYSDHATIRKKYDKALNAILKEFTARVLVPMKMRRGAAAIEEPLARRGTGVSLALRNTQTVFLAHSFASDDDRVNQLMRRALEAMGLRVLTGEKPRAERISEKVKRRIDASEALVGLFTRRDKFQDRDEWGTSPWLIDEKAYALAKGKKLVLLKESGVSNIGGLQGDAELVPFDRAELAEAIVRLIEMFHDVED